MTEIDLSTLAALVSAAMLGAMLFFAGVVAPLVFKVLPSDLAGGFLRALFPRYYDVLALVGILAALLSAGTLPGIILTAVALLFVFSRFVLVPRINGARDASLAGDQDAKKRFGRLHGASVLINITQMIALVVAIAWLI